MHIHKDSSVIPILSWSNQLIVHKESGCYPWQFSEILGGALCGILSCHFYLLILWDIKLHKLHIFKNSATLFLEFRIGHASGTVLPYLLEQAASFSCVLLRVFDNAVETYQALTYFIFMSLKS